MNGEQNKKRPPKTLKCSRFKTIRPKKLKSSYHVDLMRTYVNFSAFYA